MARGLGSVPCWGRARHPRAGPPSVLWQRQRQGDDKVVYGPVKVGAAATQMLSLTPQK